jgi:hypothetical protein
MQEKRKPEQAMIPYGSNPKNVEFERSVKRLDPLSVRLLVETLVRSGLSADRREAVWEALARKYLDKRDFDWYTMAGESLGQDAQRREGMSRLATDKSRYADAPVPVPVLGRAILREALAWDGKNPLPEAHAYGFLSALDAFVHAMEETLAAKGAGRMDWDLAPVLPLLVALAARKGLTHEEIDRLGRIGARIRKIIPDEQALLADGNGKTTALARPASAALAHRRLTARALSVRSMTRTQAQIALQRLDEYPPEQQARMLADGMAKYPDVILEQHPVRYLYALPASHPAGGRLGTGPMAAENHGPCTMTAAKNILSRWAPALKDGETGDLPDSVFPAGWLEKRNLEGFLFWLEERVLAGGCPREWFCRWVEIHLDRKSADLVPGWLRHRAEAMLEDARVLLESMPPPRTYADLARPSPLPGVPVIAALGSPDEPGGAWTGWKTEPALDAIRGRRAGDLYFDILDRVCSPDHGLFEAPGRFEGGPRAREIHIRRPEHGVHRELFERLLGWLDGLDPASDFVPLDVRYFELPFSLHLSDRYKPLQVNAVQARAHAMAHGYRWAREAVVQRLAAGNLDEGLVREWLEGSERVRAVQAWAGSQAENNGCSTASWVGRGDTSNLGRWYRLDPSVTRALMPYILREAARLDLATEEGVRALLDMGLGASDIAACPDLAGRLLQGLRQGWSEKVAAAEWLADGMELDEAKRLAMLLSGVFDDGESVVDIRNRPAREEARRNWWKEHRYEPGIRIYNDGVLSPEEGERVFGEILAQIEDEPDPPHGR